MSDAFFSQKKVSSILITVGNFMRKITLLDCVSQFAIYLFFSPYKKIASSLCKCSRVLIQSAQLSFKERVNNNILLS